MDVIINIDALEYYLTYMTKEEIEHLIEVIEEAAQEDRMSLNDYTHLMEVINKTPKN